MLNPYVNYRFFKISFVLNHLTALLVSKRTLFFHSAKYTEVKMLLLLFVLLHSIQAMESKLLVGGKNIVDHTNEQQRMLEQKRQEIAEQVFESGKKKIANNFSLMQLQG